MDARPVQQSSLVPEPPDVRSRASSSLRPLEHLLAGASGGVVTAILTSPLDVLRTRLQSDFYGTPRSLQRAPPGSKPTTTRPFLSLFRHVRETTQIVKSINNMEGWRGFYRGLMPSLAGVVPATAIKFYVYGGCKTLGARLLGYQEDAALLHAQAAIAAGIATATATNPIWLIKTRLQLDKSQTKEGIAIKQYRNSIDCLRKVVKQEGVRGLYRGLSASYLGTVETALHLVLYEQLKVVYRRSLNASVLKDDGWDEVAHWISTSGASGTAKIATVMLTYPHE
ncbi:hypothetical protein PMIN04_010633, partial [Paraphaeosphaeria minitans]